MPYRAKIITDHIAPSGFRKTTMELEYPRMVHSEMLTHRVFSRNAASSRAIPVEKMIEKVMTDPAMPVKWGANQKGMQAYSELQGEARQGAIDDWFWARDRAVESAQRLLARGVHKQIANRPLEPYSWITVVLSGTMFIPMLNLRCHHAAQPEFQHFAWEAAKIYYYNQPLAVEAGYWSTPYIHADEMDTLDVETRCKVSAARCGRVSYLTQDGLRSIEKDLDMYAKLVNPPYGEPAEDEPMHASPFEHVAQASEDGDYSGNFQGWNQLRKEIPYENRTEYLPFLRERLENENLRKTYHGHQNV